MDLELDFDPQTVCRICLSADGRLLNLFASSVVDGYLTAVPEMISSCLDLKVNPQDHLPGKLCSTCKTDVTNFYIFKQKSKRTDQVLRAMIPLAVASAEAEAAAAASAAAVTKETASKPETAAPAAAAAAPTVPKPQQPLQPPAQPQTIAVATVKPTQTRLQCEFCEQTFATSVSLQEHCDQQHTLSADPLPDDAEDESQPQPTEHQPKLPQQLHFPLAEHDGPTTSHHLLSILDDSAQLQQLDTIKVELFPAETEDTELEGDGDRLSDTIDEYEEIEEMSAAFIDDESSELVPNSIVSLKRQSVSDGCVEFVISGHESPGTGAVTDYEVFDGEEEHLAIDYDLLEVEPTTAAAITSVCPLCAESFALSAELTAHLQLQHNLYRCDACGQMMNRLSKLQQHQQTCGAEAEAAEVYEAEEEGEAEGEHDEEEGSLKVVAADDDDDEEPEWRPLDEEEEEDDDRSQAESFAQSEPAPKRRRLATAGRDTDSPRSVATTNRASMFCEQCDKTFTNQKLFERHTRMHELMSVINTYLVFHPCHECRVIFAEAEDWRMHRWEQHGVEEMDAEAEAEAEAESERKRKRLGMAAKADSDDAETAGGGGGALEVVSVKPEIDDDGYTDYQFLEDDGYESGEYRCGLCEATFATSQETKYHVVNHVQRFECPLAECGCTYDQFVRYALHMTKKHLNGEAHRCSHCGAGHSTYDEMQAHIKSECVEKKWACTHCDKKFFSNKALRNHLSWSKGKRHKCEHCGKTFAQPGELTIHMRIHTEERPFVCTVCGKSYKTSSMRASHMDTHIPGKTFECTICKTMLQTRTCYRNHMARHTKEKKHECPYCQKRFFTRYHVKQHVSKVHEKGLKPPATAPEIDSSM